MPIFAYFDKKSAKQEFVSHRPAFAESYGEASTRKLTPVRFPEPTGQLIRGKSRKNLGYVMPKKQLLISVSTNLLVEHFYYFFSCSLTNR